MQYHTDDPDLAIAEMNRTRAFKRIGVIAGIVLALVVAFGATVAMYSNEPQAAQPPLTGAP